MCEDKIVAVAVYGTLKSDGVLFSSDGIVCMREDKVKGTLFNVSGANFRFPGIKLDSDRLVDVEIQIVTEEKLRYMDAVEGSLYTRKQIVSEGGVPCFIFEWNGGYERYGLIEEWVN